MYERFVELLQKRNITAYRVSKETGVTQTTLSDWKNGRATPRTATLQKIADYFGVSLDWLTGNSDCPQVAKMSDPVQLSNVYLSFAKNAQDQGIDPEDIKLAIKLIKQMRKEKE